MQNYLFGCCFFFFVILFVSLLLLETVQALKQNVWLFVAISLGFCGVWKTSHFKNLPTTLEKVLLRFADW